MTINYQKSFLSQKRIRILSLYLFFCVALIILFWEQDVTKQNIEQKACVIEQDNCEYVSISSLLERDDYELAIHKKMVFQRHRVPVLFEYKCKILNQNSVESMITIGVDTQKKVVYYLIEGGALARIEADKAEMFHVKENCIYLSKRVYDEWLGNKLLIR